MVSFNFVGLGLGCLLVSKTEHDREIQCVRAGMHTFQYVHELCKFSSFPLGHLRPQRKRKRLDAVKLGTSGAGSATATSL